MKNLLLVIIFSIFTLSANSQANAKVGTIVYFEGNVQVNAGQSWKTVKLKEVIQANHILRTPADGIVEISWDNGSQKTTLEPDGTFVIKDIQPKNSGNAQASTKSIFSNFRKVFKDSNESRKSEEGGIRRSLADLDVQPDPKKLYWKEEPEVSYEEAVQLYEEQNYAKAIWAFRVYINQKPRDKMAKYAMFAMGHSYIMVNNPAKARETFEVFVARFTNDPLKDDAEMVLTKLPS